ncbi:hypothetical protein BC332_34534 [Capsicum chinense]|nr:hypothetical protein BC332_34534 [Capsicum chinense]
MASSSEASVYLICIKVNNKLRVRIISNNYFPNLNCQFPKALRVENQIYRVSAKDVKLVKNRFRDFYSVGRKNIVLVEEDFGQAHIKIFTEENNETCCVCMDAQKFYVFIPCGHFYVCKVCQDSQNFKKCPICRSAIFKALPFSEIRA